MAQKTRNILSEEFVREVISEPKYFDSRVEWVPKIKKGSSSNTETTIHLECRFPCSVVVRKHISRVTSFSVVLLYNKQILVRYNGYHSDHKNTLEKETIRGPHIHTVTERYQELTDRPDGFAVQTDKYHDLDGAIKAFQKDMNIRVRPGRNSIDMWIDKNE